MSVCWRCCHRMSRFSIQCSFCTFRMSRVRLIMAGNPHWGLLWFLPLRKAHTPFHCTVSAHSCLQIHQTVPLDRLFCHQACLSHTIFSARSIFRYFRRCIFLGAFARLRKATISFVLYVWPAVRLSVCSHGITRLPLDGFFLMKFYIWIFFQNLSSLFKLD